jgi:phosphoribosylamine--glycine ligase
MEATINAMRDEMIPYRGVLYGGLMLTAEGFKTLEFNVRFGDPETQVVLPRLTSDLLPALLATLDGKVRELEMQWTDQYCVCVVMASGGYPGKYRKGIPITGLKAARRVLNVVALGKDFEEARGLAYQSVEMIGFEGRHFRTDIGYRAIEWQREHEG